MISMASLVTVIQAGKYLQFIVYEDLTFSILMTGQSNSLFLQTAMASADLNFVH